MAHNISKTKIFNKALILMGASPVSADTDNLKSANTLREIWDLTLLSTFQDHPWRFAKGREVLSPTNTTPVWEWDYQFELPADFVRLLKVKDKEPCVREGNYLLANTDTLYIQYTRLVTDISTYPGLFMEALAARLAADSCERIVNSTAKVQEIMAFYDHKKRMAQSIDSQEGDNEELDDDDWIGWGR